MEDQAPTSRAAKGPTTSASKSAHVIDLRQSGKAMAPARPAKPSRPARAAKKVAAAPTRGASPSAYSRAAAPTPSPVVAPPAPVVSADFFDAPPPTRRFWPAFWRFLLLLIVLGLIICGGVYLYLKFYNT